MGGSPLMSHEIPTRVKSVPGPLRVRIRVGVIAGLSGGVLMGLIMQFPMGAMDTIGALVGVPSALGGWFVHLVISALFGVAFAVLLARPFIRDLADSAAGIVGLGIGWGAALGLTSGGVVLPLAVNALGVAVLPVPLLPFPGIAGSITLAILWGFAHLLYGATLGIVFAYARGQPLSEITASTA